MEAVSIIGVDLAKNAFQVHGAAADGSVVYCKKLSRPQFALDQIFEAHRAMEDNTAGGKIVLLTRRHRRTSIPVGTRGERRPGLGHS